MKVQRQDYNQISVLGIQGDIDTDSVTVLEDTIRALINESRTGIVLDMNEVSFIDSQGLERLLWVRDYCQENSCQLRLAGLDENCSKILEITRLNDEFDSYQELSMAVKSFA